MSQRLQCEFSLIRYVPDVVKGEFVNIGVLLREAGGPADDGVGDDAQTAAQPATQVRFTRDWSRVRCMHPDADVQLLESLEVEMSERLREGVQIKRNAKPMLATLEDSLSNSVQLTALQGTLAESLPAEMEQLLRLYVEPLKMPTGARRQSGRTAIAAAMRREFERGGVWQLMRKRIAAAQYTQAGDPLKLDCGYRTLPGGPSLPGKVKIFQAVALENDVEGAKGLAYSVAALRAGVLRAESVELELTAIVEPVSTVADREQYRFGVSAMEREAIRVLTVADLGRVVEAAKRELNV